MILESEVDGYLEIGADLTGSLIEEHDRLFRKKCCTFCTNVPLSSLAPISISVLARAFSP
jgi:hypothetical protein